MKKILLSALALMAFGFSNAQEVSYGVKGGLNLSNLAGDIEDAKSLFGAHVGAFAEIKITDKFSVQPELLFSMQGAKQEYTYFESFDGFSITETEKSTLKLGYLNLPVMAKYYVNDKFSLEAGPQIGFLLSAKVDYEYTYRETFDGVTETESESGSYDIKDEVKSIDLGFGFGAAYKFTENLSVGARYTLGLTSIAKDFDGESADIKNNVLQVSIGYKF
ncbi:porin family protein [Flavobacterium sp. UBA6135]|uniref:porin family protein n=1 Tax=Flavobacterium sp. UBA6135 TaxID=1946553 RepID=UPI0025BF7E3B|nr:porin family protein [Flavobacterium sp. UBA6135]